MSPDKNLCRAAFRRANGNAGRKAVRGLVPEANPWDQCDWIKGPSKPIREFDAHEILSPLAYLETYWSAVFVFEAEAGDVGASTPALMTNYVKNPAANRNAPLPSLRT